MEIDARGHSLQSLMDQQINEAYHEENLVVTGDARGHIVALKSQLNDLTIRLREMRDENGRASERASVVESRRDEPLA